MIDLENRILPTGTLLYFPEWKEVYILAQVDEDKYNLIDIKTGRRKTATWTYDGNSEAVPVPEYTWLRGGPPEILALPGEEVKESDLPKDRLNKCNLNKQIIEKICASIAQR